MILITLQLHFLSYDLNKISKHCHRTLSFFSSVMDIIVTSLHTICMLCRWFITMRLNFYDDNLSSASKIEVHDITGSSFFIHQFQFWSWFISVDELSSSCSKHWYPVTGMSDKNYDSPDLLYQKSVDPCEPRSGTLMVLPPSYSDLYPWN